MKIEAKDKMVREKARENKKSKLNSDFSVIPVSDKISKEKIGYSKPSVEYGNHLGDCTLIFVNYKDLDYYLLQTTRSCDFYQYE